MTDPPKLAPTQLTALSDPENVGWVKDEPEPLTETEAYCRMRGMVPPARIEPEE